MKSGKKRLPSCLNAFANRRICSSIDPNFCCGRRTAPKQTRGSGAGRFAGRTGRTHILVAKFLNDHSKRFGSVERAQGII